MAGPVFLDQLILRPGQSSFQLYQPSPPSFYAGGEEVSRTFASNSTIFISRLPQSSDALFWISSAPSLAACLVLLCRAFLHIPYRPQWVQRFVNERNDGPKSLGCDEVSKVRLRLPQRLLVLAVVGLITQVVLTLVHTEDLIPIPRVLAWVSRVQQQWVCLH